jgi:hypothetical protein
MFQNLILKKAFPRELNLDHKGLAHATRKFCTPNTLKKYITNNPTFKHPTPTPKKTHTTCFPSI